MAWISFNVTLVLVLFSSVARCCDVTRSGDAIVVVIDNICDDITTSITRETDCCGMFEIETRWRLENCKNHMGCAKISKGVLSHPEEGPCEGFQNCRCCEGFLHNQDFCYNVWIMTRITNFKQNDIEGSKKVKLRYMDCAADKIRTTTEPQQYITNSSAAIEDSTSDHLKSDPVASMLIPAVLAVMFIAGLCGLLFMARKKRMKRDGGYTDMKESSNANTSVPGTPRFTADTNLSSEGQLGKSPALSRYALPLPQTNMTVPMSDNRLEEPRSSQQSEGGNFYSSITLESDEPVAPLQQKKLSNASGSSHTYACISDRGNGVEVQERGTISGNEECQGTMRSIKEENWNYEDIDMSPNILYAPGLEGGEKIEMRNVLYSSNEDIFEGDGIDHLSVSADGKPKISSTSNETMDPKTHLTSEADRDSKIRTVSWRSESLLKSPIKLEVRNEIYSSSEDVFESEHPRGESLKGEHKLEVQDVLYDSTDDVYEEVKLG
ncbi:uncharacterized protein LOC144424605 [Styela clava]